MKKLKMFLLYLIISIFSFSAKEITDDYEGAFDYVRYYIANSSFNNDMVVDRNVSNKIFEKLLKSLDPNKMFLTKEDISVYKDIRYKFGNFDSNYYLYFGNHVFDRFQKKQIKLYEYAINKIKKYDFNFYTQDSILLDREKEEYAKDDVELEKLWDKKVLNDVIRLRLANETKENIQKILKKRYESTLKNQLKLTKEEKHQIIINAYTEMFDPHNAWYGADGAKEFEISNSLSLVGMGVSIQQRGEGNVIVKVIKGGPADKSKAFFPGDMFVYVGEGETGELVDVSSFRIKDLTKLIRGKEGTVVRIGVRRDENSPVRIIRIVREKIKQEDEQISSKIIKLRNKKVGYVLIPGFYSKSLGKDEGRNVSEDLKTEIMKFKKDNISSMVIDLRNNGGGSLSEVINMVGYFIGSGKVAVQVKDEKGRVTSHITETNKIWDKPLVVMVNRNSASASEIFSGAMKDYNRGIIVGNTTWGKGSVQRVQELQFITNDEKTLFNFGQFNYTINMFFRPNGSSTQIKGVSPDIEFFKSKADTKYGEFKYENALKWEKIDNKVKTKFRLSKSVEQLKRLHDIRISKNPKWQFLKEQIEFSNKYFDVDKLSLNLSSRINERNLKKEKQEQFKNKALSLKIPVETIFVLDNGLAYNEENISEQLKREEILKQYIDPQTYEAAEISLDLVK